MPRYIVVAFKVFYGGDDYSVVAYHDDLERAQRAKAEIEKEEPGYKVAVYGINPRPDGE